jgi:hypothetical protein
MGVVSGKVPSVNPPGDIRSTEIGVTNVAIAGTVASIAAHATARSAALGNAVRLDMSICTWSTDFDHLNMAARPMHSLVQGPG